MKWVKTAATASYENYTLFDNETSLLFLHFNARTGTARIESEGVRRVFMIDRTGFFKNKVALLNEYGYEMGHLGFENVLGQEGFIKMEDERFLYRVQNNSLTELEIYKNNYGEPLVSCGLKVEGDNPMGVLFRNNESLNDARTAALLMAICWYLFLPVAKETVDYAV